MEGKFEQCYICGQQSCGEDSDHMKITQMGFAKLLEEKAGFVPEILKLKSKIKKAFLKLENHGKINLGMEIDTLYKLVDKLHFWHLLTTLNSLKDIQAAIFGYMLTKNQIIRLIVCLDNQDRRDIQFPAYQELLYQVHQFKKNRRIICENNDFSCLTRKFIEIIEKQELLQKQRNNFQEENFEPAQPINHQENSYHQNVFIYGLPFNIERSSLDLSSLQLNDQQLIEILPSLQKMRNLKEFSLRNNKLSKKGYRILLNCLPKLDSLDLSGSNSDNFIEYLPQKFPFLRTLYLNSCYMNSQQKINKVINNFPNLKVLYLNSNNLMTDTVKSLMNKKCGLMYVCIKQNNIETQQGEVLYKQFLLKGGYFEF